MALPLTQPHSLLLSLSRQPQTTQELDYSPAFLFLSYSSSCLLHAEWPYLITGATGPKVSSWEQSMSRVTLLSRVGSKKFFPTWCRFPPVTTVAPLEMASLTCFSACVRRKGRAFGKAIQDTWKMFKPSKTVTGFFFLFQIGLNPCIPIPSR